MKNLIVLTGFMSALNLWALPMVCEDENYTVKLEKFSDERCTNVEILDPETSGSCVRATINEAGSDKPIWTLILHGSDAFDHYPKVLSNHYFYEILGQSLRQKLGVSEFSWKYGYFPRDTQHHDEIYLTLDHGLEVVINCNGNEE